MLKCHLGLAVCFEEVHRERSFSPIRCSRKKQVTVAMEDSNNDLHTACSDRRIHWNVSNRKWKSWQRQLNRCFLWFWLWCISCVHKTISFHWRQFLTLWVEDPVIIKINRFFFSYSSSMAGEKTLCKTLKYKGKAWMRAHTLEWVDNCKYFQLCRM